MKRVVIPELLDTDSGSSDEIAGSLRDLNFINRCFGGISTMGRMIRRVAAARRTDQLSMLDVAAASGDVAASLHKHLREIQLSIVLLDRASSHFAGKPVFPAVAADALALPFPDNSFDVVTNSLFVHHLEPEQIVKFIPEALRVARVAVLINDLRRSAVHYAFVMAGLPLFRSPITRHDSLASVKRSYTPAELRELAQKAGVDGVEIRSHYFFRMGAILWKPLARGT